MTIHINPLAQAELELVRFLLYIDVPPPPDAPGGRLGTIKAGIMEIMKRALAAERLTMGQHEDCGADNPEGIAALCKCYCHKGHYRHAWQLVSKNPIVNPDGITYHLLYGCKYCPDIKFKIIKTGFVKEKHSLVNLEYLVRGDQRVLLKEEWLERTPEAQTGKLIKEAGL